MTMYNIFAAPLLQMHLGMILQFLRPPFSMLCSRGGLCKEIGHFRVALPLFQNESWCTTFVMEIQMSLICTTIHVQVKLIIITKVVHQDSFRNRGKRQLGNDLINIGLGKGNDCKNTQKTKIVSTLLLPMIVVAYHLFHWY